jgi:hypothetical protein
MTQGRIYGARILFGIDSPALHIQRRWIDAKSAERTKFAGPHRGKALYQGTTLVGPHRPSKELGFTGCVRSRGRDLLFFSEKAVLTHPL